MNMDKCYQINNFNTTINNNTDKRTLKQREFHLLCLKCRNNDTSNDSDSIYLFFLFE